MENVTLEYMNIAYKTGDVTGNWVNDTVYVINGDIIIPQGENLVIQEGTNVKFMGYHDFRIDGRITAVGTEQNPVIFSSFEEIPEPGDWQYMDFKETASSDCLLEYCVFEYGRSVKLTEADITVKNCRFRYFSYQPFDCYKSSVVIMDNHFMEFKASGIELNLCNDFIVTGNEFAKNSLTSSTVGILVGSSSGKIANNVIYDQNTPSPGHVSDGINIQGEADLEIFNNIIYNCQFGIFMQYLTPGPNTSINISNNILYKNSEFGIFLEYGEVAASIKNNIVVGNEYGIRASGTENLPDISYNNVWNNVSYDYSASIPGIGQIVSS
ncbi:MAG: right-handed parallel beta-helix repeat-containing protein, partial [Bacteroidales bacterium]|nr:right-handed parallel beta-helix repeat-containing protein [Bacteroidales bacterium]